MLLLEGVLELIDIIGDCYAVAYMARFHSPWTDTPLLLLATCHSIVTVTITIAVTVTVPITVAVSVRLTVTVTVMVPVTVTVTVTVTVMVTVKITVTMLWQVADKQGSTQRAMDTPLCSSVSLCALLQRS